MRIFTMVSLLALISEFTFAKQLQRYWHCTEGLPSCTSTSFPAFFVMSSLLFPTEEDLTDLPVHLHCLGVQFRVRHVLLRRPVSIVFWFLIYLGSLDP